MTIDQAIAFAIIFGMMILFVWDKIRYDQTALLGLVVAMATGIVPVDKAFGGFSDQVVIIVGSALIISAGVAKSGVIGRTYVGQSLGCARLDPRSPCWLQLWRCRRRS